MTILHIKQEFTLIWIMTSFSVEKQNKLHACVMAKFVEAGKKSIFVSFQSLVSVDSETKRESCFNFFTMP